MKKQLIATISIFGILIFSLVVITQVMIFSMSIDQLDEKSFFNYTPHGPIVISHDDNFTDYGW